MISLTGWRERFSNGVAKLFWKGFPNEPTGGAPVIDTDFEIVQILRISDIHKREMGTEGKTDKEGRDFTPDHRRLTKTPPRIDLIRIGLLLDGPGILLPFPLHLTGGNVTEAVEASLTEVRTQGER